MNPFLLKKKKRDWATFEVGLKPSLSILTAHELLKKVLKRELLKIP